MKVLRVPRNLAWLSWSYWVIPILLGFHVALASHAEWWRLPWRSIGIASLVGAAFASLFFWGTRRQKLWVPVSARVFFVAWAGVALWVAVRELSTGLAAFFILLVGFLIGMISLIDRERARSFLDPRMQWFEGRPRLIPGLSATLFSLQAADEERSDAAGEKEKPQWRAARFDREGVFLFLADSRSASIPSFVLSEARVKIEVEYRAVKVTCEAEPIAALHSRRGLGFRLRPATMEQSTDLGRLVEAVRGEGYAEI